MCGIVGYLGHRQAVPIVIAGLKRLEYRGYDSVGIAIPGDGKISAIKTVGKVAEVEALVAANRGAASVCIGHTRWATHGEPSDVNAHPHLDCHNHIAVIHNGIIENYSVLKKKLVDSGHFFRSSTDTEVLAHLIEELSRWSKGLEEAVRGALQQVKGTYGVVVMSDRQPDKLIAARHGSPLVIGHGEGEYYIASDATAIAEHTRRVSYLDDGEVVVITRNGMTAKTLGNVETTKSIQELAFDLARIERGGYDHFMLKEIYEQPETIRDAMRGRLMAADGEVKLGGLEHVSERLMSARRIILVGCGTSWHAALVGEYLIEQIAKLPVEVEYASEFRYRSPVLSANDVVFFISQSGETADTLAALREAKSKGALVLGIVNVVGSTIARESDGGVYVHAGPEIGVASTKAFTSQLTVLALIAIYLARARGISSEDCRVLAQELQSLPSKVGYLLRVSGRVKEVASEFKDSRNFLYLGRGANYPVALEGALKLKEVSYIHAEGYPAAEMKHGPIALIDENMPVVFLVPKDALYDKVVNNMHEVRARRGRIIAIANEDDREIEQITEFVLRVPRTYGFFGPIVNVIPLQLLAYYIAVARGVNVDQPRNLARV